MHGGLGLSGWWLQSRKSRKEYEGDAQWGAPTADTTWQSTVVFPNSRLDRPLVPRGRRGQQDRFFFGRSEKKTSRQKRPNTFVRHLRCRQAYNRPTNTHTHVYTHTHTHTHTDTHTHTPTRTLVGPPNLFASHPKSKRGQPQQIIKTESKAQPRKKKKRHASFPAPPRARHKLGLKLSG